CSNITLRREWRTLDASQRQEYTAAVQCLKTKPSRLHLNHTLYDDFPWVHSRVGEYVHDAAPFLAWHRYFIHIYELALKDECVYTGTLPYWNWELDWSNITQSPIWDSTTGFGGDGSPSSSTKGPILDGYCVSDGPFAGLQILYLDSNHYPHCLSRGFLHEDELLEQAEQLKPEKLEVLHRLDGYEEFNLGVEHGPHLAVPRSIRGDFSLLTAPSDPVFFLHHAQLDRVWWRWQAVKVKRKMAYAGLAARGSESRAETSDLLDMGGLAPMLPVSEILDTTSGLLCYTY
ncbi:Di-copper centre-containing protein, partial [Periconia macrospinosa]